MYFLCIILETLQACTYSLYNTIEQKIVLSLSFVAHPLITKSWMYNGEYNKNYFILQSLVQYIDQTIHNNPGRSIILRYIKCCVILIWFECLLSGISLDTRNCSFDVLLLESSPLNLIAKLATIIIHWKALIIAERVRWLRIK